MQLLYGNACIKLTINQMITDHIVFQIGWSGLFDIGKLDAWLGNREYDHTTCLLDMFR